ncbi:hypothetical protein F2Q70_00021982 [Brassica cretica]|uniref:Uncharacterized protein n=2 Tax=Brassica cretica TaxID=69181 RepID=A0A8S9HKX4_BRACR|nr:hypothetical protein F2Q70_00021982 [Brassica cretica]KAF2558024.1 hypothetical protein F2Q68_00015765 [Brassica cretica]KAF3608463.1 hypothetical protein DY000_02048340 [Brassica cretica]
MMDQLARDEAKYDKEINDMEVGDTKHIHFALSLLIIKDPPIKVSTQNRTGVDQQVNAEPIQYEDPQEKTIDNGVEVPKEKVDDHNGHGTYDPPIKSGKGAQTSPSCYIFFY